MPFTDEGDQYRKEDLGRVATTQISVHSGPSDQSRIVFQRFRDELLHIYDEVISEDGPGYNPRWYRVWGGFVHSARVQRVKLHFNSVMSTLPENGQLMTITVPYSQSAIYNTRNNTWRDNYRLYYGSNHWVIGVDQGPNGEPWYRVLSDLTKDEYHAPAKHFRPILKDELQPIRADLPLEEKRVEVVISRQEAIAYESDVEVRRMTISSGVIRSTPPGEIPTATPRGNFFITTKMPSKHMGGGILTDDPEAYVLPGVPWVCFFEPVTGVAFHGTYWHDNFGATMSKGCVNMTNEDARWLYLWSLPEPDPLTWVHRGYGTRVVVV